MNYENSVKVFVNNLKVLLFQFDVTMKKMIDLWTAVLIDY